MSPHRLAFFSAAIVTVLTAILTVVMPAGIASAASVTAAGNRVWATSSAAHDHARADRLVSAGEHQGEPGSCPFCVSGACVAPEDAGLSADQSALDYATTSSKLDHIFAAKHNFDPLVQQFGSREAVVQQFLNGLNGLTPDSGTFEQQIVVGGQKVIGG